jgi:hypothetical protein
MPLPSPREGENEEELHDRCMGDDVAVNEFPDESQRSAVCHSRWEAAQKDDTQKSQAPKHDQEERDVVFMVDPEAHFVSLVSRGANQIPFRVVKIQDKQRRGTMKILQSIIAPAETSEDTIKEVLGEELADRVKFDTKAERGKFVSYEQMPREVFKEDSYELVVLDEEKGIRGLQAVAKEDEGLMPKLFKRTKKVEAIEVDAPAEDQEAMKNQFSEAVMDEIWKLENAVAGILAQEKGEPKAKLKAVKMVLGNFQSFLEEVLAVTKEDKLEISLEKKEEEKEDEPAEKAEKEEKTDEPKEDSPKEDKEAPAEEGKEADEKEEKSDGPSEKEDAPKEDAPKEDDAPSVKEEVAAAINDALAPLKEMIENATKESKAVADRIEKVEKSIPMVIQSRADDESEPAKKTEKSEKGTFSGTLFK